MKEHFMMNMNTKPLIFCLLSLFITFPNNKIHGKILSLSRNEIIGGAITIGVPLVLTGFSGYKLYTQECKKTDEKPSFKKYFSFLKNLVTNKNFRTSIGDTSTFDAFSKVTVLSVGAFAVYKFGKNNGENSSRSKEELTTFTQLIQANNEKMKEELNNVKMQLDDHTNCINRHAEILEFHKKWLNEDFTGLRKQVEHIERLDAQIASVDFGNLCMTHESLYQELAKKSHGEKQSYYQKIASFYKGTHTLSAVICNYLQDLATFRSCVASPEEINNFCERMALLQKEIDKYKKETNALLPTLKMPNVRDTISQINQNLLSLFNALQKETQQFQETICPAPSEIIELEPAAHPPVKNKEAENSGFKPFFE